MLRIGLEAMEYVNEKRNAGVMCDQNYIQICIHVGISSNFLFFIVGRA